MKRYLVVLGLIILSLLVCGCSAGSDVGKSHTIYNITVTMTNANYTAAGGNAVAVESVGLYIQNNKNQTITLTTNNFALYDSAWLDHLSATESPAYPDFDNKNPIVLEAGESGNYTLHMNHAAGGQKMFCFIPDGIFGHESVAWDLNVYGD